MNKSNVFDILKQKLNKFNCNHFDRNGNDNFEFESHMQKAFESYEPKIDERNLTKCAILIILFRSNGKFHVVLTIRAFGLKSFPGEIWLEFVKI